ncbi:MAG: response regulator [Bacteroidetes bacterium]|nr:response regulator [Bacteroidota bacterium]
MNEVEFLQKLREAFAIEADEHYRAISKCLTDLEHTSNGDAQGVIELIFREAHSLKGAARAINRVDIEALCQALESLFSLWKKDPKVADRKHFDATAQAVDILAEMLTSDTEFSLNHEALETAIERLKELSTSGAGKGPARPSPWNAEREAQNQEVAGHRDAVPIQIPESSSEAVHSVPQRRNLAAIPGLPTIPGLDAIPGLGGSTACATPSNGNAAVRSEVPPSNGSHSKTESNPVNGAQLSSAASSVPGNGVRAHTNPEGNQHSVNRSETESPRDGAALSGTGAAFRTVKDTIRVSISELESLYRQTEELSSIKFMLGRHAADLRRVMDQCREWIREYHKQRQSVLEETQYSGNRKRDVEFYTSQNEKLQNFMKWTARQVEGIESAVGKNLEDGRGTMYIMESMSEAMMENAKQLLLLPFSLVTDPLPGIVRKLARDLNKDLRFQVLGDEIRIDKRILEALKDPLLHLLRNSIDHGIEDAATRARCQKSVTGSITLTIQTATDNRIELLLEDDGRGIDIERVKCKAITEGVLTEEKARKLADRDALDLVFLSGITTSPIITDLSGRGVGLNVVRENILGMGGEIDIETDKGTRTLFRISLPLSLSNARGVLVRSQGKLFVVPLQFVERGLSMHRENFSTLDGKSVIDYHGRTVTVRRLEEILTGQNSGKREERPQAIILLLRLSSRLLALEVDEILWEQDVVIKPLPAPVSRVRTIAGATLLSSGELVLVLQIPDLFDASRGVVAAGRSEQPLQEARRHRLLVVDDSITSRVLLHDILVNSGYEVQTAVDGIDALTHMREEHFDLIVSDVEMPRMNGFELTEAVRKDEKMHDTPLILVTGLESQEDRERGFDVGANAYINKSSFDQSNLIDVIERLI